MKPEQHRLKLLPTQADRAAEQDALIEQLSWFRATADA